MNALDDIDLAAAIAAELRIYAPQYAIVVGVTHGSVTLEGDVAAPAERDAIEARVRRFAAVREIVNQIAVRAAVRVRATSREGRPAWESPH